MSDPKPPPGFRPVDEPPPPPGFRPAEKSLLPEEYQGLPHVEQEPESDILAPKSKIGTAVRSYGKGGSFGFGDELGGVMGAIDEGGRRARSALFGIKGDEPVENENLSLKDALVARYRRERDANRQENIEGNRAHPLIAIGGEVAGAIAAPLPFGKAKAGGLLTKAGVRLVQGGVAGLANGIGNSDADVTRGDVGGALKDGIIGAGEGAVGNVVVGQVADAAGRGLRKVADSQALKAIGQRAGISNLLRKLGYETADEGRQLGRAALETGTIPKWGTAEDVARNSEDAKGLYGAMIGDVVDQAATTPMKGGPPGAQFTLPGRPKGVPVDYDKVGWRAVTNAVGPDGLTATAARQSRPAARLVEDIVKTGESRGDIRELNRLKSDMYDGINYSADNTKLSTGMQRNVARGVKESVEDHIREHVGDEAADQLKMANQRYGQMSDINKLAADEATRQTGRTNTLTGLAAGAGTAAAIGGPGGMAAGVGMSALGNYLRPRLPGALAHGGAALSKSLPSAAGRLGYLGQSTADSVRRGRAKPREQRDEEAIQAWIDGG